VRPEDVQLGGPGGQQFAQVQAPGNASDVPLLGGPQLAQNPPSRVAEKSQAATAATPVNRARLKEVPNSQLTDTSKTVKPSNEGQAQQKEAVEDRQLDSLVAGGISGELGNVNNNPTNIRVGTDKWIDAGKPNGAFVEPNAPDAGVRMTVINLQSYAKEFAMANKNLKSQIVGDLPLFPDGTFPFTIGDFARKWAPFRDSDNDPHVWQQNVAKFSKFSASQLLNPYDHDTLVRLIKAMNRQEKGVGKTLSDDDIERGVTWALTGTRPSKTQEKRNQEIRDNVMNAIDGLHLTPDVTKRYKDQANKKLDDKFGKAIKK